MPQTFAVYVPKTQASQRNLGIGTTCLTWGWKDTALDAGGAREVASQLKPGDCLVFGSHAPSPRMKPELWKDVTIGQVLILRATTELYRDESSLWPDDVYPNRVGFEIVTAGENVGLHQLGAPVTEALRWSGTTRGVPVAVQGSPLVLMDDPADQDTVGQDTADRLDHDGEFNALAMVLIRREQQKIRNRKFGKKTTLQCDICGRILPARFVRAAHIKRRSKCSLEEMGDLHNIMGACVLGCDEMFEHGFITVGEQGCVMTASGADGDLAVAMSAVEGRACAANSTRSAGYFAWHRREHTAAAATPS